MEKTVITEQNLEKCTSRSYRSQARTDRYTDADRLFVKNPVIARAMINLGAVVLDVVPFMDASGSRVDGRSVFIFDANQPNLKALFEKLASSYESLNSI